MKKEEEKTIKDLLIQARTECLQELKDIVLNGTPNTKRAYYQARLDIVEEILANAEELKIKK